MNSLHELQLVNTLGHSAGAIIFGIFLYLLLHDRAGTRLRGSWLSVTAASLAFLWNVGSLAVLMTSSNRPVETSLIVFFSFSVLSLLPAVLLQLSLTDGFDPVVAAGYGLSAVAIGMHLWELLHPGAGYQRRALLLITAGFSALTAIAVVKVALQATPQRRAKASRIAGAMCSALFAMSFVHFGSGHPSEAWSQELVFHHAGIPLALFVLLQDYRFVLLDAFVRFLANALLAAVAVFLAIRLALRWVAIDPRLSGNPLYETLLLVGFCVLLIVFALLRSLAQRWLTKVVFRRADLERRIRDIQSRAPLFREEAEFLAWSTQELAEFMSAERVAEVPRERLQAVLEGRDPLYPAPASDVLRLRHLPGYEWVEAIVPLRLAHSDVRYVLLGRRRGGRRYLSEDLASIGRLAAAIVEQVERFRDTEMRRLVSQAELRALQSQINPHFLFNALNTLYGVIPRNAPQARQTVLNLADIFRYFLQSEKTFIPLSEELEIVKAYLEIERLRLGPRLETRIAIDEAALSVPIPILSIQPLVENAVKHGLAAKANPGVLHLTAAAAGNQVVITVRDTGPGMSVSGNGSNDNGSGVGLANVRRRLQLCFGPEADLDIQSSPEGTQVEFAVPLARAAAGA
ncbi:MAG TPA: histidine kinase [Bryobacteraceae bacterium]|nr:histidine kinase [Bryobacteraceae bacterium]